ncbi:MAG TPA: hypothetical protein VLM85_22195 [Polyangiaceae bacterium]|nr:hypothetical protein [Polyangiaceae bacterium]
MKLRKHPLETILALFGDVHPGEAVTVLLLALNVFLILTSYYLLKVAREPLVLLGGGAEIKSYASLGQTVLLIGVASLYGWLSARVSCIKLIAFGTVFFVAQLLLFWVLGLCRVKIAIPFYLWVGVFNVVTITQFWSFAADTYTEEQGKRLFPIVGIGSSFGAVGGAWLAAPLIRLGSPFLLMLVSAAVLAVALAVTFAVYRRETGLDKDHPALAPLVPGNAFALVLRDRYLLVFALLVLALNYVTKSGDYVLDRMLLAQAPDHGRTAYIGQFKAHYFEWVNLCGVVLQLFFVSRIVKYLGLRTALVLVPIASLGGYGATLIVPIMGILFFGRVVESSLDYTLSNTSQQTLWLPTSREAKYKAKQVVDGFFRRGGDALSAGVVWVGAHFLLSTRAFLAINVAVTMVWVGLAWVLGRDYAKRVGRPETPSLPALPSLGSRGDGLPSPGRQAPAGVTLVVK